MNKFVKIISVFLIFVFLISNTLVFADADNEVLTDEYKYGLQENIEDIFESIFNMNAQEDGITPRWGKDNHEETVDTSYGTLLTNFMKTMSMVPDSGTYNLKYSAESGRLNYLNVNDNTVIVLSNNSTYTTLDDTTLKYRAILHGRGNYVASLRFLYTVAKNLVNNTYIGTNISKIQQAIEDSLGTTDVANNTFYGENKTFCNQELDWVTSEEYQYPYIGGVNKVKQFTSLEQRLALEKFIYIVANCWFSGQNDAFDAIKNMYDNITDDNVFEVKTALKIIGIATHLCGDLYAHKTVVPTNTIFLSSASPARDFRDDATIYRGESNTDFNGGGRWSARHGIKTLVTAGSTITTQQISEWKLENGPTGYADVAKFYSDRLYIGAKQLVANMYDNFFNGDILGNTGFYVNWFLHTNYTLRLANLKVYTFSIGSAPTIQARLQRLRELDSAVAMSDILPAGGYTTPDDTVNTWNKGYTASCAG